MKKGKHHHTGKIRHSDMGMHHGSRGMGGKDPHASAEHHAANKEHGMDEGMSPMESSEGGGGVGQGTIPDMEENCCEET